MKVEFNDDGRLIILAENPTEKVALNHWQDVYREADGAGKIFLLAVDTDKYKMAVGACRNEKPYNPAIHDVIDCSSQ